MMFRLFAVLGLTVLVGAGIFAAGCGSSSDSNTTSTAGSTAASVSTPTVSATQSKEATNYLDPANFADQVDQLKKKEGSDAQLLMVTAADGVFTSKLRKASNDTAYGYESNVTANMAPVKVEVSGSGSLKPQAFPISKLQSSADKTIVDGLKKIGGPSAKLTNLTLQRNPASGNLMWTVGYDTDTRTSLSLFAPASGSPLSKSPVS